MNEKNQKASAPATEALTHTVNGLRRYRLRISGENGSHAATSKFAVFGAYASWNP